MARGMHDDSGDGRDVRIATLDNGLVIEGSDSDVKSLRRRLVELINDFSEPDQSPGASFSRLSADSLAAAAGLGAIRNADSAYVRLSPDSMRLLKAHGAVPDGNGYFHAMVRGNDGIVGNIKWSPVDLSPERALAIQSFAVHMALRAAIKDLAGAVERVENQVGGIAEHLNATAAGEVLGVRETLHPKFERLMESGRILGSDWSEIQVLGTDIRSSIGSRIDLVKFAIQRASESRGRSTRSSKLGHLCDGKVRDSLYLLAVSEHNLFMWQELRVANTEATRPSELGDTVAEAAAELEGQQDACQRLLDSLQKRARALLEPSGLEGLRLVESTRLAKRATEFNRLAAAFALDMCLDHAPYTPDYATFRQSLGVINGAAQAQARRAANTLGNTPIRSIRRKRLASQPVLDQPDDDQ